MHSIIALLTICIIISIFFRKREIEHKFLSYEHSQYLKGIATIFIIISHLIGYIGETVLASPLGGIGVAMFLFLSGYGLQESYKKNTLNNFWRKKILRIFIPYTIFITLKSIIYYKTFSFKEYIMDIFFIDSSYWYISYLIKCYVLFYISCLLNKYKLIILALGSFLSLLFLPEIEAEQSFSFILGVVTSLNIDRIRSIEFNRVIRIGIFAILIGIISLAFKQITFVREDYKLFLLSQLLIKLPIGIGVIIVSNNFLRKNWLITQCGTYSLELYLVHMQTLKLLQHIHPFFIFLSTFIIITPILTYMLNILCKKCIKYVSLK